MSLSDKSVVAVTGATGFIGSLLCEQLRQSGYQVHALVRDPAKGLPLNRLGVHVSIGDLENESALQQLLKGASHVIHAAGAVRGSKLEHFSRVNVDGTERLLNVLQALGQQPKLLLISSMAAREPSLSWYSQTKHDAERLVSARYKGPWAILRPAAVYGPGDKEMLPIFQWMSRGFAWVPGASSARTSLIHVSDLIDAIIGSLGSDQANGATLNACDGKKNGYSWHELSAIASEFWSRPVQCYRVPRWLLDTIAHSNLMLSKLSGRLPMLTPRKVRELRHLDWVTDNQAITRSTGWQPKMQLAAGLSRLQ